MQLKPINFSVETQEDIKNIMDRRRLVIIYKYNKPHNTEFFLFRDTFYDLYVLNYSVLNGINFLLPKDVQLHSRNSYRGSVCNPFNEDGTINFDSEVTFLNGWFSTRLTTSNDILYFNRTQNICGNQSIIDYVKKAINTDILEPLPIYYTMEDQVRLERSKLRDIDFNENYHDVPRYTLRDLSDIYTKFVVMDIENDDFINGAKYVNRLYDPLSVYQNKNYDETARETISVCFVRCFEALMDSAFSQAAIVFDFESDLNLYKIDKEMLRIKHSVDNKNKEYINLEYAKLVQIVDDVANTMSDVLFTNEMDVRMQIPSRVTFFISDTLNKIKVSMLKGIKISKNISGVGYSTSDCEEQMFRYNMGLYPYEFMENNPILQKDITDYMIKLRSEDI